MSCNTQIQFTVNTTVPSLLVITWKIFLLTKPSYGILKCICLGPKWYATMINWCVELFYEGTENKSLINSLRPSDAITAFSQTTFSSAFSWMKILEFWLIFHWNLFLRVPLTRFTDTNIPALVQVMAWRHPGDKPLSEPMLISLPTHICVTQPQWVKSWLW